MSDYLVERLNKTRFRPQVGTETRYYVPGSTPGSNRNISTIVSKTFGNQTNELLPERPEWQFTSPIVDTNYLLAENEDVLMTENNDNLEV